MADGFQAGSAWVDVLPSLRGFQTRVAADLRKMFPRGIAVDVVPDVSGIRPAIQAAVRNPPTARVKVDVDKASLAKAEAAITASEGRLAKARDSAADALGAVRVAETNLAQVREKAGGNAAKMAAAEERLEAAKRRSAAASRDVAAFERQVSAARENLRDVKVNFDADTRAADAKIGAFATRMHQQINAAVESLPDVKLGIDANTDKITRRILHIKRELEALNQQRIGIDINAADAQRRLAELSTELTKLSTRATDIQVRADTAAAAAKLSAVDGLASRLNGRNIKLQVDTGGLSQSIVGIAALSRALGTLALPAAIVAATPYVLSLASSLVQASAAAWLLPAALTAGGVAAGTLVVGLSGIGDAFTALAKDDEAAASRAEAAGKARESALRGVRSAQQSLDDAQRSADRAAEQGAVRVADARRALSDAVSAAADRVRAAQDSLTRAEQRARDARDALNRAYREGREELQQLQFSIEGAGLAEEEAADRLEEARQRLAEARASGAGAEEVDDLDRAVRQADLSLRQASDRYADLKAEGAEWARTGVSGSAGVAAAQRQVEEADRDAQQAQAALTQARVEGDRQVADARRELGRTIVEVNEQQADAARAVERATVALAEAQAAAATAGTVGASESAAAMAKLSPQARALVGEIRALGPAWTAMRLDVQDRLLAGIGVRVGALGRNYIPILNSALGRTADGFNRAGQESLGFLNSSAATGDMRFALDNMATSLVNASGAARPLTAAFTDLLVVGSTFLPRMGTGIADLSERFAGFIARARESGQLAGWIRGSLDALRQLGQLVVNVGSIMKSSMDAARGSGESFLSVLVGFTGRIADVLRTPEGAAALTGFFTGIRVVVSGLIDRLVTLWPVVQAAGGAFLALWTNMQPLAHVLFGLVATVLPPLLNLIGALAPILGPVLAAILGIRLAVAAWAAAQWVLNAALNANPIGIVIVALTALVAGLVWAWKNSETFRTIVTGVWDAISAAVSWAWKAVIKPVWDALVWTVRSVIAPAVLWLWNTIIWPAFQGIGAAIAGAWNLVIKPIWDALVWTVRNVIGPTVLWLWNNVIRPAWDGIGAIIGGTWRNVIKPAWDALVGGLHWVKDNFDRVVGWIGDIWRRLKGLLAKPINFMIGTVWNQGIRRAWNLVAGILPGIDPIGELPLIPEMASGGRITGGIPGKDSVPILAMQDEFVVRREVARPARRFLEALNAGQPEALQAAGGRWARFAAGGPVERGLAFARAQHGKPYVWGGVGPGGYDCSGLISAIGNVLMGRPPHRRIGTTDSAPWRGWARGLSSAFGVGFFKGRPGHMSGTLAGNNVEAGGSPSRTKFVHGAAGARSRQFTGHMSLPQVGGQFIGGGDGGSFLADQIRKWVREMVDPLINRLPAPPPAFAGIPRSAATKVRDLALDWFLGQSDAGDGTPGSGPVRDQVRAVAHRFGWGSGRQWAALDWLINKESSWNPLAQNPQSSAFGLYQFLDSTWATVGGHKTTNPGLQAEFGNRYIRGRRGDPIGAQAFHRSHGWYDDGGFLPPGYSTVYNGTGGREALAVLNEQQWRTLRSLGEQGGAVTNNWTIYEANDAAETAMKIQRRQEMLARTGAPL